MMVGYELQNTLTDFGHVARGICETDEQGMLKGIVERTHIAKREGGAFFTEDDGASWTQLPLDCTVSMNMWGFTASILKELKEILKVRKTIVFPGLGRLRATRENNFFFIPDEDLNIYPDGFGLEPLSLKTHVETEDDMRAAVASLQQILDEPAPAAEAVPASEERPAEQTPAVEVVPESVEAVEEIVPKVVKPVENVVPEARGKGRRWWIVAASIVAAAVLLLVVFVVLARIAPDFVDSILYTEEELDIIRQI